MESHYTCSVLEQAPGPWVTRDSGGSGLSSCWVLLMTRKANRRGMAPDQAFPSVSNGFNLEDVTASVNWHMWQGVLLLLFSKSSGSKMALLKRTEPESLAGLPHQILAASCASADGTTGFTRLGVPRGHVATAGCEVRTVAVGSTGGVASKPHSQFWSLTPVLIFPFA